MFYIRIDSENTNKLIYYCRNCGNEDNTISNDNVSISKIQIKKSEQEFTHFINKYTKLDPTLPRIYTMLCPNAECKTNAKASAGPSKTGAEIIYLRYDADNLKYLYICSECNTTWKTDEKN
jgi:DNA-directed RNA polymerase subunit RPC12/RpoP